MSGPRLKRLIDRRKKLALRLLARVSDHYRASTNDQIRAEGFSDFTDAHTQVLFHLEIGGNRITTLAERARITVQAMGKLVRDLETKGYVERRPDPDDGRAVRIVLSEKGTRFFETAIEILEKKEAEMVSIVGADRFHEMKLALAELADHVNILDVPPGQT